MSSDSFNEKEFNYQKLSETPEEGDLSRRKARDAKRHLRFCQKRNESQEMEADRKNQAKKYQQERRKKVQENESEEEAKVRKKKAADYQRARRAKLREGAQKKTSNIGGESDNETSTIITENPHYSSIDETFRESEEFLISSSPTEMPQVQDSDAEDIALNKTEKILAKSQQITKEETPSLRKCQSEPCTLPSQIPNSTEKKREYMKNYMRQYRTAALARSDSAENLSQTKYDSQKKRAKRMVERIDIQETDRQKVINPPTEDEDEWYEIAKKYKCDVHYEKRPYFGIGQMKYPCKSCEALRWLEEKPGLCCSSGQVKIEDLGPPPDYIKELFQAELDRLDKRDVPEPLKSQSRAFVKDIKLYNSLFQMTSLGANVLQPKAHMDTFKVSGQIHHRIGSILPNPGEEHKFLQLYFINDVEVQLEKRLNIIPKENIHQGLVKNLQKMLLENNPYVRDFQIALNQCQNKPEMKIVIYAFVPVTGQHPATVSDGRIPQVSAVQSLQRKDCRDLVVKKNDDGSFQRIMESHRSYDCFQYPIMHSNGQDGFSRGIHIIGETGSEVNKIQKTVSIRQYYAYRLMVRRSSFNIVLKCKQLTNQYIVDQWIKVESDKFRWHRLNQSTLRSASYHQLSDAAASEANGIGHIVILPATHTGSPRYMMARRQDLLTYASEYGPPDLFITLTFNPKWPEVIKAINPGEHVNDRPDIIARVFHLRAKKFWDMIKNQKIFGPIQAGGYFIEHQKATGFPHLHSVFWLEKKLETPADVDSVVCAEIPDPKEDPQLFDIILANNIHGPCGKENPSCVCMKDGKCSKGFPKPFNPQTNRNTKGFPLYKRRSPADGGMTAQIETRNKTYHVDNRWVVPYNPFLSKTQMCHENTEAATDVGIINYLTGYVTKGSDVAAVNFYDDRDPDEIKKWEVMRTVCSSQASWRLFEFPIQQHFPPVIQLTVHLENGQRVVFNPNNPAAVREKQQNIPMSKLIAYFSLCQNDEFARSCLYVEIPKYYVWVKDESKWMWKRRRDGIFVEPGIKKQPNILTRMHTVHPAQMECFCLRLLLSHRRGPTSYTDLRTIGGITFETYKDACSALGLLDDDRHWNVTLMQASQIPSPKRLRHLFCIIITECHVTEPQRLWDNHKESLCKDIWEKVIAQKQMSVPFTSDIANEGLILIEDLIYNQTGKRLRDYNIVSPNRCLQLIDGPIMIRETFYDREKLSEYIDKNEPLLLDEQRILYEFILTSVRQQLGKFVFIDAFGGTGKTFVLNLILDRVRIEGNIALATASSGNAATLLHGGRTAHSTLKLPFDLTLDEECCCNVDKGSDLAQVLQRCRLLILDEITMIHKNALNAIHTMLRDIRKSDKLFGGLTVVLAGDFRQTLPIIPKGSAVDEVAACVNRSHLWRFVTRFKLTVNMRAKTSSDPQLADWFNKLLLKIGDGKINEDGKTEIKIPKGCGNLVEDQFELIDSVFPDIANCYKDDGFYDSRAILAPTNAACEDVNEELLRRIPEEAKVYISLDRTVDPSQAIHYTTEFLNSLSPSGLPAHKLTLKKGSPIILLRNIQPPGLCNGTRLVIVDLLPDLIMAKITTGPLKGEITYIPKIPLIPSSSDIEFIRIQFPVALCFCMTLNKAQGQSLSICGLNLEVRPFSHGQLYVGLSRCGSPKNLYIYAPGGVTNNIVYDVDVIS